MLSYEQKKITIGIYKHVYRDIESFMILDLCRKWFCYWKWSCYCQYLTVVHTREGHCKLKAINEESFIKHPDYWPEISSWIKAIVHLYCHSATLAGLANKMGGTINYILTLKVRGPSYLGLTRSISWLLMPWLLMSPGHQQPWYWLCRIGRFLSYLRKHFNYLRHINVEKLHKM